MEVRVAIIGGTGVYDPGLLEGREETTVTTPYGEARVSLGRFRGIEVGFLTRHGPHHSLPPHRVNYRANIRALRDLGFERVLATAAVGSLNPEMKPGEFVLVDQFVDFTRRRESTFFEGGEAGVVHVDFTEPYCPELRASLARAARELEIAAHEGGVYVCTEGPRFETPAEIRAFRILGGDLVGMTNVPEVVLAREANLCYALVAAVTNFAAGISPTPLTHEEVLQVMAANTARLRALLERAVEMVPPVRHCRCGRAAGPAVEG
ncbi:MAG: S-methyl-5'-thioadenosine phosphorylase [Bacillota bacterium]|nr:S-methyl-5'-thioadenosine phosphorylase [Bacillota bacterium]